MNKGIVNHIIYEDLINQIDQKWLEVSKSIVQNKKVKINKVTYTDENNFSVRAIIVDNGEKYCTYIKAADGEIEDLSCGCDEYKKTYCACTHIVSTMTEFINNPEYVRIFAGNEESKIEIKEKEDNLENYKVFNQLIHTFMHIEEEKTESASNSEKNGSIHIEPKIIYSKFNENLKLEIKIGEKQLYKIKSLPEFYNRFLYKEKYKYGSKLEFVHEREAFEEEDKNLLDYVLKYAEIIKYANESANGYDYYTRKIGENAIVISNSGLDELFSVMESRKIIMEDEYSSDSILLVPQEPEIKFNLESININEYKITTNIDIYDYRIYRGNEYVYILIDKKLYRCSRKYEKTVLKVLEIFRKNFTKNTVKLPLFCYNNNMVGDIYEGI